MGPLGITRYYQPVRRLMRQGVVYMIVVKMPSEAELANARAEMEKQKKEDGSGGVKDETMTEG